MWVKWYMVYRYSRFKNKLVGFSVYWVFCRSLYVFVTFLPLCYISSDYGFWLFFWYVQASLKLFVFKSIVILLFWLFILFVYLNISVFCFIHEILLFLLPCPSYHINTIVKLITTNSWYIFRIRRITRWRMIPRGAAAYTLSRHGVHIVR
jgi:hypothetical protein